MSKIHSTLGRALVLHAVECSLIPEKHRFPEDYQKQFLNAKTGVTPEHHLV